MQISWQDDKGKGGFVRFPRHILSIHAYHTHSRGENTKLALANFGAGGKDQEGLWGRAYIKRKEGTGIWLWNGNDGLKKET